MDVLSLLLREMRFEGAGYRRLALRAPWAVSFDQAGLRGIHIVLEGRCEIAFGSGRGRALAAGDLVLATRADAHVLRAPGSRVKPLPSLALAEAATPARATHGGTGEETVILCGAFVFHEADHPALAALPRLIHVPGESGRPPAWLAGYVDAITAEAFAGGPGSEVVMARLSEALVARALRFNLGNADEPGWLRGLADPRLARALALVHDRPSEPWTVATLARASGLSRAAFAARFSRELGEAPMRYLLRHRMRRAMAMLRDRASLARVAEAIGYGSEAAFAAAFKRHVGTPPGAYRRADRRATS